MNLQNKSVVLNIVLAIVVVVLSVRLASDKATVDKSADAHQSVNAEQAVLDNIATRNDIIEKSGSYGSPNCYEQAALALCGC